MEWLLDLLKSQPWVLVLGGLLLWLYGPQLLEKLKVLAPKNADVPEDAALDAVEHYMALKEHCKDCPEAQEPLRELWRHLEPGSHKSEVK